MRKPKDSDAPLVGLTLGPWPGCLQGMAESLSQRLLPALKRHYPSEANALQRLKERADRAIEWCDKHATHILVASRDEALEKIFSMPGAPEVLFARGNLALLTQPSIAIVGTRRASSYGLRTSIALADQLCDYGFTIASGLALGIDTAATAAAFQKSQAAIAVLAHGLDTIYPRTNAGLGERLAKEGGLLVSEYFPGTPPLRHHFPERNRILAALALGTVVVEAPEKSGALITARCAAEYGRDVFVVPGWFGAEGFKGNHRLLHEGAKLVAKTEDIVEEYRHLTAVTGTQTQPELPFELSFSLEEVLQESPDRGHEIPSGLEALEAAIQRGHVIALGPQRYVRIESPAPRG